MENCPNPNCWGTLRVVPDYEWEIEAQCDVCPFKINTVFSEDIEWKEEVTRQIDEMFSRLEKWLETHQIDHKDLPPDWSLWERERFVDIKWWYEKYGTVQDKAYWKARGVEFKEKVGENGL